MDMQKSLYLNKGSFFSTGKNGSRWRLLVPKPVHWRGYPAAASDERL